MGIVVFETVEILVSLAARFTFVRLLFLHAQGPLIGDRGLWIDDREGTICVIMKPLAVVTVLQSRLDRRAP